MSGSGISWAVCKSAPRSRQTTTPLLFFYRPDALPAAQPTASKHWRHCTNLFIITAAAATTTSAVCVAWAWLPAWSQLCAVQCHWQTADVWAGPARQWSGLVSSDMCRNTRVAPAAGNDVAPPSHTAPTRHTCTHTDMLLTFFIRITFVTLFNGLF